MTRDEKLERALRALKCVRADADRAIEQLEELRHEEKDDSRIEGEQAVPDQGIARS